MFRHPERGVADKAAEYSPSSVILLSWTSVSLSLVAEKDVSIAGRKFPGYSSGCH
jgi:hypothetical protein